MKDILNYFHSEEITNSGIIPRLASIKNFCEEITAASTTEKEGYKSKTRHYQKAAYLSFIFLLKRERNVKAQL